MQLSLSGYTVGVHVTILEQFKLETLALKSVVNASNDLTESLLTPKSYP